MLYDVLPPLVFFVSLGGIILVVSRVVLRIRRVQLSHSIQALSQHSPEKSFSRAEDLAHIVGPSKKSVLIIRNRLAFMLHLVSNSASRLLTSVQQHRHTLFQRVTDRPRFALRVSVGTLRAGTNRAVSAVVGSAQRWRLPRARAAPTAPSPRAAPRLTIIQQTPPAASGEAAPAHHSLGQALNGEPRPRLKTPALPRARQALEAGHFKRAEKILVPFLIKHPKNARAYMMLAEAAVARGTWSEALEIYEQVVALEPRREGAYAALGKAAFQAGKFTRAIEALQLAHNANPQDTSVIKLLLKIARRMDNAPLQRSLRGELQTIKKAQKQLP